MRTLSVAKACQPVTETHLLRMRNLLQRLVGLRIVAGRHCRMRLLLHLLLKKLLLLLKKLLLLNLLLLQAQHTVPRLLDRLRKHIRGRCVATCSVQAAEVSRVRSMGNRIYWAHVWTVRTIAITAKRWHQA